MLVYLFESSAYVPLLAWSEVFAITAGPENE